jgi:hypothetical protein
MFAAGLDGGNCPADDSFAFELAVAEACVVDDAAFHGGPQGGC